MPSPSERFNNHAVHEALSGLGSRLSEIPKELKKEADATEPTESVKRAEAVVDYTKAVLGAADPLLVTGAMLAGLEAPMTQTKAAVDALIDQSDVNQAQQITNSSEAILDAIGAWPMTTAMGSEEARKATKALGGAAKDRLSEIKKATDQMKGEVDQVREDLDTSKASVQQTTDEQIAAIKGTVEQIQTEVEAEKARATGAIDGIQAQFNAEKESRDTEFEETKNATSEKATEVEGDLQAEATRITNELTEKADATSQAIEERGNTLVADLEEKRTQAERLVDLVATSSTAGAFGKEANEQKTEADKWRDWTVKLGLAAAAVALVAVAAAVFFNPDPSVLVAKAAVVVLLTGLATYAARQSGDHRQREVRARRLELQMVAFGPITEPLDDPEAERDARKGFIGRMFPGDTSGGGDGDAGLTKEDISLVGQLIRELKNAVN